MGLRDRFPLVDRRTLVDRFEQSQRAQESDEDIPHFDSVDDLPDSPMLRQYIEEVSEYLNKPEEDVINSKPVRDYMKRLGVWEQVKNRR